MLSELVGKGWVMVEPPLEKDGQSTVARFDGNPINAGFLTECIEDTEEAIHRKYRSGKYDLEVKVDFDIGRGQVKVEEAPGYSD